MPANDLFFMKRLTALLPLLFVLFACRHAAGRSSSTPPAIARWHFQGATFLETQSVAPTLAKVTSVPGAEAVGTRLATNLIRGLTQRLSLAEGPALISALAPLANDLLRYESAGEVTAQGWQLTVHLPSDRATVWQQKVAALGALGTKAGPPTMTWTNGWVTVGSGPIGRRGWLPLPAGNFLNCEGDFAEILKGTPADWPRFQLTAGLASNTVITRGSLEFSKPPLAPLPEWKLPDRLARAPFTQFSAVRGVAPLLDRLPWWHQIYGAHSPDQLFTWSTADGQLCSWLTAPVTEPQGNLERIFTTLLPYFGTNGFLQGRPELATNREAVAVFNPLGVKPVVGHVRQGSQDYLLAALFPGAQSTNPFPKRLRATLLEPNLVYQDVEFTPESFQHWNAIFQLYQVMKGFPVNAPKALAHQWIWGAQTELGDAVTAVHQVSPHRFTLERTSSVGLTGLELVLATRWLDGPIKALPGGRLILPVPPTKP